VNDSLNATLKSVKYFYINYDDNYMLPRNMTAMKNRNLQGYKN